MEDNITRLLVTKKKKGCKCIRKRKQVVEINFRAKAKCSIDCGVNL